MDKEEPKYNSLTKEKIEKIVNDIYLDKNLNKDREFRIYFGSQEAMDNWNEQFSKALKEHIKNWSDE